LGQYTGDEWNLASDPAVETSDRDGDGQDDVMIEPSAPQIESLAHQIADPQPDVYSKAKALYEYMHDNFRYSTPEEMDYVQAHYGGLPKHSLATLRDGWGDCDEQSMLYISLLRAVGIPARLEMGMLYDQQHNTWGGHAWMQVYIPAGEGSSWYNVDVVNSEFLLRDCNRLTTWVDDGNGEHLSDYYHVFRGTSHFDSEDLLSVSYQPYGEVKVTVGSPEDAFDLPGFTMVSVLFASSIAIFMKKRRERRL
jgi:transglutaminase-like putative cysteine protease